MRNLDCLKVYCVVSGATIRQPMPSLTAFSMHAVGHFGFYEEESKLMFRAIAMSSRGVARIFA